MNLILSIEDYQGYQPNNKHLEDALPMFTLIYGWALSKNLLADTLVSEPYTTAFHKVECGKLTLKDFAIKYLDGKITKDMFNQPWIAEYVSDYIQTGTYSYDLNNYFKIDSVFELPDNWHQYTNLVEDMSKSFDSVRANYN